MRRVLIQACLVATAAVQLSACCCNSPTPDRPPPPTNYPPPPPPQPYVPPPQPVPQPPQYQPAPQPYPQPYTPPPQPYNGQPPQPPPGYHPAAPIPNGGYTQPPPPNTYPPAPPSQAQGPNEEAAVGSEAVAYAASHGMPNARVIKVRFEPNNLWKVMLRAPGPGGERRMHVYVVPNHGGVRTGVTLANPSVQGWSDDER